MIGLQVLAWSPLDPWHVLVLGIVALLLFGKRLPEVGRSLGKGIAEFKKGLHDVQDELNKDDTDDRPKQRLQPPPDADDADRAAKRFAAGEETSAADEGKGRSDDE